MTLGICPRQEKKRKEKGIKAYKRKSLKSNTSTNLGNCAYSRRLHAFSKTYEPLGAHNKFDDL